MKSDKLDRVRDVPITPDHWDMPMALSAGAYKRFCRQMDQSLRQLVARWEHRAAPNARRIRRS